MTPVASAHAVAETFSPSRRRIALVVAALAFLLELLDSTIVNLAIPSIRHGLGADPAMMQWIVAGYALSFSMLLIVGGRLGDALGYRRLFLGGVAAFAVSSLLCGLAVSPLMLAASRGLQGAAAAMMAPQVMAMVQLLYPPHQRGAVMGLFGTLGGLGASLGPVLGGLLIRADLFGLSWRPIFLINLPLAAVALVAGVLVLPKGRSPHPVGPDPLGALLVIATAFLLVFPLIEGRELGWPAWMLGLFPAAALSGALFVAHTRRAARAGHTPIAPPVLFRRASFSAGLGVNLLLQSALGGYFLCFSLALQLGLGLDVLQAALTTLPFSIGVGTGVAVISRRLSADAPRRMVTAGMVALGLGWALLALAFAFFRPSPWLLAPVLLLAGIGMGMAIGPLSSLVLCEVDIAHAGAAAGVMNAVQQLGGAIGAAALGSLYFSLQGRGGAGAFQGALAPTLAVAIGLLAAAAMLMRRMPARIAAPV